ncbi:aluminum-activated malate transporter 8-like [Phalaenopsis equestris]|uniref:aluminum-activated malate transporter 8-like n=1 Tax=Phalaenopsis equestris TaxID=78828 RepID=UPI0009E62E80|nr:aluminum-activated malate transporter 8-like [Phalaenopsis equestris]
MEAAARTNDSAGFIPCIHFFQNIKYRATELAKKLKKIGKDDPRRIFHSFKVGLALSLISIFYYLNPIFTSLGSSSTMWAILTVVVVMEYTAGGTLSKGLNRTFATLIAGALGLAAQRLAHALSGHTTGEPILLSVFVFLIAAMATFSRFVPEIKARYDYGVMIFILTFSLVAVSGYREEELIKLALQRLSTIGIGVGLCLAISMFVFPVWAGEDLHELMAANIDKLACFLEGLEEEYFGEKMDIDKISEEASFLKCYKSVLNSKPTEDSLANFARWEPGHGRFGYRHPWQQYAKLGALTRQCAYSIEALNSHISTTKKNQVITDTEFSKRIRTACSEMSTETGKALAELATAIREMRSPSTSAAQHLSSATEASRSLYALSPAKDASLPDILQSANSASLLSEVVKSGRQLAIAVEEFSCVAHFKRQEQAQKDATVNPVAGGESPPHVVIEMEK